MVLAERGRTGTALGGSRDGTLEAFVRIILSPGIPSIVLVPIGWMAVYLVLLSLSERKERSNYSVLDQYLLIRMRLMSH